MQICSSLFFVLLFSVQVVLFLIKKKKKITIITSPFVDFILVRFIKTFFFSSFQIFQNYQKAEETMNLLHNFRVYLYYHPMGFPSIMELENVFKSMNDSQIEKILGYDKLLHRSKYLTREEMEFFKRIFVKFMKNGMQYFRPTYTLADSQWLVENENEHYIAICRFYSFFI